MQEPVIRKADEEEEGKEEQEEDTEEAKRMREIQQEEEQRILDAFREQELDGFEYKLAGVVIHMGTAEAGHYLSYANIEREQDSSVDIKNWAQTSKQTWLEFNDNNISRFDFSNMEYKAFGEEAASSTMHNVNDYEGTGQGAARSHNAYMLIYEKAVKTPLKVVCRDEDIRLI